MAKLSFSKLGLKLPANIKTVNYNGIDIEVKQYLPVADKAALMERVLTKSHDERNFSDPIRETIIFTIEVIEAYTNIAFTDKQKEDYNKLYDLLNANGVDDLIFNSIPSSEYSYIVKTMEDTIESVYKYENSILGILNSVSQDYSNLKFDAEAITEEVAGDNKLTLLKDVMDKLG